MIRRLTSVIVVLFMIVSVFAINAERSCAASSSTYWLKVNTTANVVNVYKKSKGEWKPYKVLLCSCGKASDGHGTPKGKYTVKKKWRWQQLFYGVSGQYVTQFYGNYLFHSVVYSKKYNNKTCKRNEYNKLGKQASHGCVRLATMDAKWIYENCPKGTKVTVYSSDKIGPLGKPSKVAMKDKASKYWDPTDPADSNKAFALKGPVISVKKSSYEVEYGGEKIDVMKGVTAKSPYTFQNLTSSVKVSEISYTDSNGKSKKVKSVDTKKPGVYKVKLSCYNKYCGKKSTYKTIKIIVKEKPVEPKEPEEPQNPIDPEEQQEPQENLEEPQDSIDTLDQSNITTDEPQNIENF